MSKNYEMLPPVNSF